MMVVFQHALGDVPSPILVGLIKDTLAPGCVGKILIASNGMRFSFKQCLCCACLFVIIRQWGWRWASCCDQFRLPWRRRGLADHYSHGWSVVDVVRFFLWSGLVPQSLLPRSCGELHLLYSRWNALSLLNASYTVRGRRLWWRLLPTRETKIAHEANSVFNAAAASISVENVGTVVIFSEH